MGELLIILAIVVILFGGSRLASVGRSLGEGISNFRKGLGSTPGTTTGTTAATGAKEEPLPRLEKETLRAPEPHRTTVKKEDVVDV
jgi:sec-independent protein translocase protein TatA